MESLNKSTLCANQHVRTPSEITSSSSTKSSNQEIRNINEDSLTLEQGDMQANISLPPSIDQVKQHSQNIEKGSFCIT